MPTQNEFDKDTHLSVDNISVDNKASQSIIQVTIRQSKTDHFRKGVQLFLKQTHHQICPVKAILSYLALRGTKAGHDYLYCVKNLEAYS